MLIEKQGRCILLDLIQEIILNCDLKIELSSYLRNSTYSVEFQQFYKFPTIILSSDLQAFIVACKKFFATANINEKTG